jgi:hypothetical protein
LDEEMQGVGLETGRWQEKISLVFLPVLHIAWKGMKNEVCNKT